MVWRKIKKKLDLERLQALPNRSFELDLRVLKLKIYEKTIIRPGRSYAFFGCHFWTAETKYPDSLG